MRAAGRTRGLPFGMGFRRRNYHENMGVRKVKFTLEVTLGNDAMTDALDISEALKGVVARLESDHVGVDPIDPAFGIIRDCNGNRVGEWRVQ